MQLIKSLPFSRRVRSEKRIDSEKGKRVQKGKERSEDEKNLIEKLTKEHNEICSLAKRRGYAYHEEKVRCKGIRFELIKMRAI